MGKNSDKRCPQCGGTIDYFGSCRKCGREWSTTLQPDEQATGKPEGEQHKPFVEDPAKKPPTRTRFTKNKDRRASKPGKLPERFADWMIDPVRDGDTEIIRKRSLMRLDSRKIYNAMGLSVRAHENQKAALIWFEKVWEFLDDDERGLLAPTVEALKAAYGGVRDLAQAKVRLAAEMEIVLEKAHKDARKARLRILAEDAKKQAKDKKAGRKPKELIGPWGAYVPEGPEGPGQPPGLGHVVPIMPGQDTEGYGNPVPVVIPPDKLLEVAKERLKGLDKEKRAARKKKFRDPDQE
jgi:hypothetical protein